MSPPCLLWVCLLVACSSPPRERGAAVEPPPAPESAGLPADALTAPATPDAALPEAPIAAAPQAALPKKCAADSPTDAPCVGYGGTYRIQLRPGDGTRCLVKKPIAATITVDGSTEYHGMGQAKELAPLARALGMATADLRVGAAVRAGVCCVDLEVSPKGRDGFVRVKMARGANLVSAKSSERLMTKNDMCDAALDVTVELVK